MNGWKEQEGDSFESAVNMASPKSGVPFGIRDSNRNSSNNSGLSRFGLGRNSSLTGESRSQEGKLFERKGTTAVKTFVQSSLLPTPRITQNTDSLVSINNYNTYNGITGTKTTESKKITPGMSLSINKKIEPNNNSNSNSNNNNNSASKINNIVNVSVDHGRRSSGRVSADFAGIANGVSLNSTRQMLALQDKSPQSSRRDSHNLNSSNQQIRNSSGDRSSGINVLHKSLNSNQKMTRQDNFDRQNDNNSNHGRAMNTESNVHQEEKQSSSSKSKAKRFNQPLKTNSSKAQTARKSAAKPAEIIDLIDDDDDDNPTIDVQELEKYKNDLMQENGGHQPVVDPKLTFGRSYLMEICELYFGTFKCFPNSERSPDTLIATCALDFTLNRIVLGSLPSIPLEAKDGKETIKNTEEEIPFNSIHKICWGDIAAEDSENKRKGLVPGTLKFCSISLSEAIDLKRVDIVSGNILKLGSRPTYFRPEEHILLVAEGGNVEVMINYMANIPLLEPKIMKLPLKRGPNDTKSVQDSYDFTIVRGYTAEQERSNLILNLHQLQAKADKLKRSRRRRLLDNALPPDPEDSVTQLIYPIGIESLDAVTICKGDLKRLEEPEYWNDSLIDLRVKFYLEKMDPEKRAKVHAFSTLFYPKLTEEKDLVNAHKLVARWTKNFDIFSKDFVLVPVNQSIHWSLFVLVRPNAIGEMLDNALLEKRAAANDSESSLANTKGNSVMQVACGKDDDRNESQDAIDSTKKDVVAEEFINDTEEKSAEEKNSDVKKVVTWETDANEEPESHIEDNKNYPCILHMDSLGMHSIKSISRRLISYLHQEWIARKVNNKVAAPKNKISDEQTKAEESQSSAVSEAVSDKSCEEVTEYTLTEKELELAFKKIKQIPCKVPTQKNGYDCGVFTCRFVEMVLDAWPDSNQLHIQNKFAHYFSNESFSQEQITQERQDLKEKLTRLSAEWFVKKEEWKKEEDEKRRLKKLQQQQQQQPQDGKLQEQLGQEQEQEQEPSEIGDRLQQKCDEFELKATPTANIHSEDDNLPALTTDLLDSNVDDDSGSMSICDPAEGMETIPMDVEPAINSPPNKKSHDDEIDKIFLEVPKDKRPQQQSKCRTKKKRKLHKSQESDDSDSKTNDEQGDKIAKHDREVYSSLTAAVSETEPISESVSDETVSGEEDGSISPSKKKRNLRTKSSNRNTNGSRTVEEDNLFVSHDSSDKFARHQSSSKGLGNKSPLSHSDRDQDDLLRELEISPPTEEKRVKTLSLSAAFTKKDASGTGSGKAAREREFKKTLRKN